MNIGPAVQASKIGKYEVVGELGRGAMGVVFRALDPSIERQVAIKVIRTPPFGTPAEAAELRMRLMREARAAGKLSHPGIVTIYGLEEHDEFIYIVMEFVEGQSLERWLESRNPLALSAAIPLLRQVAEALDFAHARGVVHRDIKPANILVDATGRAKITDFGIARIVSQTVTKTGMTMGTPSYMSPEQIRGDKVDGRSGQFSLGVMVYEMLTGRKPFVADTAEALMFQIVAVDPPLPHSIRTSIPEPCSNAISKALAKQADQRYVACAEFVNDLERAADSPSKAVREGPVRAWFERNRR